MQSLDKTTRWLGWIASAGLACSMLTMFPAHEILWRSVPGEGPPGLFVAWQCLAWASIVTLVAWVGCVVVRAALQLLHRLRAGVA